MLQKENPDISIQIPKVPPFKTPYEDVIVLHDDFEKLYAKTMKDIGEEEEEEEESEDEDDETSSFCTSSEEDDEDDDSDDESEDDD
jgi:hypothetical protein